MPKRDWRRFPTRFKEEANSASGYLTLLGAGVAAAGIWIAGPVVLGIGGVIALSAGARCGYNAIPPLHLRAEDLVGKKINNLDDIERIYPPVMRIGFVGVSRAGKTTLVDYLRTQAGLGQRTDSPYATIIPIQSTPLTYFAFIDAAGQQYSQQFKVFDSSHSIIIFLDHNRSDIANQSDPARLTQHEEFLEQLSAHIRTSHSEVRNIHILMNKRDTWESGHDAGVVKSWFENHVKGWSTLTRANFSAAIHSNRNLADLAAISERLRSWVA